MNKKEKKDIPDELKYPPEEDIYSKGIRAGNTAIEEETNFETGYKGPDAIEELNFKKNHKTGGLDVPGAELDDKSEDIGEEDEENNYYSLGGDNHENLEES
jgi:hypothetical protein